MGALKDLPAEAVSANSMITEMHCDVLKNLAQACIRLGHWKDALEASNTALQIDPRDYKAWYRKACALEGLGRLDEAEDCLLKIEGLVCGRADKSRIMKDVLSMRDKLQALRETHDRVQRQMIEGAFATGVFGDRGTSVVGTPSEQPSLPSKRMVEGIKDVLRMRITMDGAVQLLKDLTEAYLDTSFQKQVLKLSRDVRRDKGLFLAHLKNVALPVQRPVLAKYGFEPSEKGVVEMTLAVQDHSLSPHPPPHLQAQVNAAMRALYGPMFEIVQNPAKAGVYKPKWDVRIHKHVGDESDDAPEFVSETLF